MKLPPAPWREREGLAALLDALGQHDGMTRFVGGAVRDTLLGLPVADIDCATRLPPEEAFHRINAAGFKAVPTGIAHGTVTAVLPDGPIEVTTLRRDLTTDGRRATVAFTDDWRADAARRDFTINALSADPLSGEIHDYFGGLEDLAAHHVRFIGDPLTRIAEDHLRVLRFFRFHARFGEGEPDAAGLAACAARANDLMALSRERIADELIKLLALPDPGPTVRTMHDHGVFTPVLPEIETAAIALLYRTIAREKAMGMTPDPLRRLAALLPADREQAAAIGKRLKLSNTSLHRLQKVAAARAADIERPRAAAYRLGIPAAIDAILLRSADDAAAVAHLQALAGWHPPRLPISGRDLIALGLVAGPIVAATLQAVERQWVEEDFPDAARVRVIAAEKAAQALVASR
jgi:poly(A) polymerase